MYILWIHMVSVQQRKLPSRTISEEDGWIYDQYRALYTKVYCDLLKEAAWEDQSESRNSKRLFLFI